MASPKEKLIEEAQKLALRGQLDKAVKAYEQLLAIDPSAVTQRQRLADILVKAGRLEEARKEFETIGRSYSSKGFYLKAIAVYKQLQKLFPADITITLALADLNEKHGLIANAIAEYKQVYDHYRKNSALEESLKILDRMQNVDPQNVGIKLKLAEEYFSAGKKDESYALFGRLASLLQERGDAAGSGKLNSRIQQLFPEKSEFMLEVLAEQVHGAHPANAISGLQSMLRSNPNESRIWDLIIEAYKRLNQPQKVKVACQHYLKFFPDHLSPKADILEITASEGDLKNAFSLLERYEPDFIAAGAADRLIAIYRILDERDPINLTILEGMSRAFQAAGKQDEAALLAPKIKSLRSVAAEESGTPLPEITVDEADPAEPDNQADQDDVPLTGQGQYDVTEAEMDRISTGAADNTETMADDLEIEIEIDGEIDFGAEAALPDIDQDWLGSVNELFGAITTSPRGVRFGNSLEGTDTQSHYDLGVAFREMGLHDEALNEFRQAATDPERMVECLALQGACLRERGDLEKAETLLTRLMKPGLDTENLCIVKYELALTCQALGAMDRATELLNEIDSANPGFRDVRSRLDAVSGDDELEFSDEDLKGFDLK